MIAAIQNVTDANGFRMGWQGIPVYLSAAGVIGRVAHCKVVLDDTALTVVNFFRTHRVPREAIREVAVADGGTLEIRLGEDRVVPVFAFGGSVIDHFRGTSERALQEIDAWRRSTPSEGTILPADPQVRWTRCRSADLCLASAVVLAVSGGIWMALTSG
ncbi:MULTISPECIES: PH domain-containing protein [unclassified Streptomyces]|uniref:PH domain-containing protein n=1 Tax=unclassified Streptomyces TaxID=2593676 RepID=UPI0016612BC9|nr:MULTISPECIES: PH domain-containing protein [unclassified Streptomyces]